MSDKADADNLLNGCSAFHPMDYKPSKEQMDEAEDIVNESLDELKDEAENWAIRLVKRLFSAFSRK